jgi:uncharacterized protein YjbI with pentapeptide repeats
VACGSSGSGPCPAARTRALACPRGSRKPRQVSTLVAPYWRRPEHPSGQQLWPRTPGFAADTSLVRVPDTSRPDSGPRTAVVPEPEAADGQSADGSGSLELPLLSSRPGKGWPPEAAARLAGFPSQSIESDQRQREVRMSGRGKTPKLQQFRLLIVILVPLLALAFGISRLVASLRAEQVTRANLATSLLSGAIVAYSVLVVGVVTERQRSRAAKRQNIQLQVGLQSSLRGIDLSGQDLSQFILRGKDLSEAVLENASLRGADLTDAVLRCANLKGADLHDARLQGADLRGADLRYTNLRRARFYRANCRGGWFNGSDLREAWLQDASFAHLSDNDIVQLYRAGLRLHEKSFAELLTVSPDRLAEYRPTRFTGADLSEARLLGADFSSAQLDNASLWGARLHGWQYPEPDPGSWREIRERGWRALTGKSTYYYLWSRSEGANLQGANLTGTDLRWAALGGVNLRDADLTDARLGGARLDDVVVNDNTKLPSKFNLLTLHASLQRHTLAERTDAVIKRMKDQYERQATLMDRSSEVWERLPPKQGDQLQSSLKKEWERIASALQTERRHLLELSNEMDTDLRRSINRIPQLRNVVENREDFSDQPLSELTADLAEANSAISPKTLELLEKELDQMDESLDRVVQLEAIREEALQLAKQQSRPAMYWKRIVMLWKNAGRMKT